MCFALHSNTQQNCYVNYCQARRMSAFFPSIPSPAPPSPSPIQLTKAKILNVRLSHTWHFAPLGIYMGELCKHGRETQVSNMEEKHKNSIWMGNATCSGCMHCNYLYSKNINTAWKHSRIMYIALHSHPLALTVKAIILYLILTIIYMLNLQALQSHASNMVPCTCHVDDSNPPSTDSLIIFD